MFSDGAAGTTLSTHNTAVQAPGKGEEDSKQDAAQGLSRPLRTPGNSVVLRSKPSADMLSQPAERLEVSD